MNYELILRYTRAFIMVVDRAHNIVYTNRGYVGPRLDNPFLIEAVDKAFEEKTSFEAKETRMAVPRLSDFRPRDIDVWVKGEYMMMEGTDAVILTITDITSIKEERTVAASALQMAETQATSKLNFLANMSHEIRTPLNAILGFSKLLMDTDDHDKHKKYCEVIDNNTRLLQQLVDDVLDMAKMDSGTFDYNFEEVDLNELIVNVDQTVRMRVQPATVLNHVLGMAEFRIVTDRNRISQVLINLLTNACKFTSRGAITFGYEDWGNEVYFFVKDTGIGISKDRQEKIFERFYKDDHSNPEAGGTGLGLPICKNIVETMHGEMGVESRGEGKGSTFWFTIPLVQPGETPLPPAQTQSPLDIVAQGAPAPPAPHPFVATPPVTAFPTDIPPSYTAQASTPAPQAAPAPAPTPAPAPQPAPAVPAQRVKPTLLVAEDNESNYLLFESILEDDFNLIHAWNGREAVDIYRDNTPDLILMDISMPYMDGYEATAHIRKVSQTVPIIAVTAYAFSSDKERIMENGFNAYVSKPVNADRLLSEIDKLLKADHAAPQA